MSIAWTNNTYQEGNSAQSDLANMEANFACLRSMFSNATEPGSSIRVPYMPWGDTIQDVLKFRDDDESEWFGIFHGDVDQKIWIYRDDQLLGWVIDEDVSDVLLAIKGGGTYVTGGIDTQGTWSCPAGSSHNHQLYKSNAPSDADEVWDKNGDEIDIPYGIGLTYPGVPWPPDRFVIAPVIDGSTSAGEVAALDDCYTDNNTIVSFYHYRPAAATGTLQSLDMP